MPPFDGNENRFAVGTESDRFGIAEISEPEGVGLARQRVVQIGTDAEYIHGAVGQDDRQPAVG